MCRLRGCPQFQFSSGFTHSTLYYISIVSACISWVWCVLQVLKYTAGHINYGGRVTDDWDRRCIMNILNDFYCANALSESYSFSVSGVFHQLPPDADYKVIIKSRYNICVTCNYNKSLRH